MAANQVVNWEAIFDDLRRHGWTYQKIADQTEVGKTSLFFYRNGGQPKHPDGERLIDLWLGVTNSTRAQVPMMQATLSAASFH